MELDPNRTAIVAVHMQRDIVTADGAFGGIFAAQASNRDVIGVTGKLLTTARDAGATVLYTRVAWQPGYDDLVANSPLLAMVVRQNCLVEGSAMAQIVPELASEAGDVVVTHQRVCGFSASQLDTLLRSRGIDTVLFCGVATNISVGGTARQASDLGYRTGVIADACSVADEHAHDAALASLGLLAEIVTSEIVIDALVYGAAASR